jgi:hypothetical protein
VSQLLEALRTEHKKALVALRSCPLTKDAIVAWTKAYHLECRYQNPEISGAYTSAWSLRTWWEGNPDAAAGLVIGGSQNRLYTAPHNGSPEDRWIKTHRSNALPCPRGESKERYVARATKMYVELKALIPASQRYKGRRGDRVAENMKWFVRVQVKGQRPADVAGRHATRRAVEAAVKRIADQLCVIRRPFSRGPRASE